jgi:hypothetical protein
MSEPNFSSEYSKTYNSFSGVDIHAMFAGVVIGEIQGISFTVSREKAPIYTMGRADPRAFCRGKRGIAGTVIFTVFDRQILLEALGQSAYFWADTEEVTASKKRRSDGTPHPQPQAGRYSSDKLGSAVAARPWYEDQIPPFSIVLVGINEYGHQMEMQIRGVEILNSGQGISVDDLMIDQQMTFICTDIIPWRGKRFDPPTSEQAITSVASPPFSSPALKSTMGTV